jgi:hypothetical protein
MEIQWTPSAVRDMLTNPIYTGMGPYPAIIRDEDWLDANTRLIEEDGPEVVVKSILAQFQETFPGLQIPDAETFVRQAQDVPRTTLHHLLAELRTRALALVSDPGLVM